jgi:COP9 signalosome complex subunit 5
MLLDGITPIRVMFVGYLVLMHNQQYQDPFVTIVVRDKEIIYFSMKIDLTRIISTVENEVNEYQSIPLHKIEDFGVHCKQFFF